MPFIARPAAGQIIDPAWGTLVADAVVMRFATAAQRSSQLTAPVLGQLTALDTAPGVVEFWTGTAWASTREVFYTAFTASLTVTAVAAAAAQTVVTSPAVTYDGTAVMVEFFTPTVVPPTAAGGQLMLNLWDGSTDLGYLGTVLTPGGQIAAPVLVRRRLTPSSGSHTLSVRAWCPTGSNGTVAAGAGGIGVNPPGYLQATKA